MAAWNMHEHESHTSSQRALNSRIAFPFMPLAYVTQIPASLISKVLPNSTFSVCLAFWCGVCHLPALPPYEDDQHFCSDKSFVI
jgi:hypothetical protein